MFNKAFKFWVTVKPSCKKERSFYARTFQSIGNGFATIPKFIARKNQRQLFLRGIATDDGPFKVSKVIGYFFFTIPFASASLAASR
jgi:hypothetical protein